MPRWKSFVENVNRAPTMTSFGILGVFWKKLQLLTISLPYPAEFDIKPEDKANIKNHKTVILEPKEIVNRYGILKN